MLDAQGLPIASPDTIQPGPQGIATGGPPAPFPIQFVPPSDCADHIDNDGDGLVDNGVECDAGPPQAPDGGTSTDGAQTDGAQTDGAQTDGAQTDGARREGGVGMGDGGSQDGAGLDARG